MKNACSANILDEICKKDNQILPCETSEAPSHQHLVSEEQSQLTRAEAAPLRTSQFVSTEQSFNTNCGETGRTANRTRPVPCWTDDMHTGGNHSHRGRNLDDAGSFSEKYFSSGDRREKNLVWEQTERERNETENNRFGFRNSYSIQTDNAGFCCENTPLLKKAHVSNNLKQHLVAASKEKHLYLSTEFNPSFYYNKAPSQFFAHNSITTPSTRHRFTKSYYTGINKVNPYSWENFTKTYSTGIDSVRPFSRHNFTTKYLDRVEHMLEKYDVHHVYPDIDMDKELRFRETWTGKPKHYDLNFSRATNHSESISTSRNEISGSAFAKTHDGNMSQSSSWLGSESIGKSMLSQHPSMKESCVDTGRVSSGPQTITESDILSSGSKKRANFNKRPHVRLSRYPSFRIPAGQSRGAASPVSETSTDSTSSTDDPLKGNNKCRPDFDPFSSRQSLAVENLFIERAFSLTNENTKETAESSEQDSGTLEESAASVESSSQRRCGDKSSHGDTAEDTKETEEKSTQNYPTVIYPRRGACICEYPDRKKRCVHVKVLPKDGELTDKSPCKSRSRDWGPRIVQTRTKSSCRFRFVRDKESKESQDSVSTKGSKELSNFHGGHTQNTQIEVGGKQQRTWIEDVRSKNNKFSAIISPPKEMEKWRQNKPLRKSEEESTWHEQRNNPRRNVKDKERRKDALNVEEITQEKEWEEAQSKKDSSPENHSSTAKVMGKTRGLCWRKRISRKRGGLQ
ncbi:hypothetical protein EGW08_008484, partial [Elysia chlorotica]